MIICEGEHICGVVIICEGELMWRRTYLPVCEEYKMSLMIIYFNLLFQLKREIYEAHEELRVLYEELQSSHEGIADFDVEALDLDKEFKPGCLTSFVRTFREVLDVAVTVTRKDQVKTIDIFFMSSRI